MINMTANITALIEIMFWSSLVLYPLGLWKLGELIVAGVKKARG